MKIETLITLGYYISSIGFLVASIIMAVAVRRFGKSIFGSIFSYLFMGTGIFFVITVFQKLGGDFFGIGDASMDIWWHIMFYLALASYYFGLKYLVGLGTADQTTTPQSGSPKKWAIFSVIVLVLVFILPKWLDSIVTMYNTSILSHLGLHHFIAFAFAGSVGYYLVSAKNKLGMIGKAIANPLIIAIWALGVQHLWELINESWKLVSVTSEVGEGVEKIFLTIAAIAISYAAWRLKAFARS